jgi:hypothetical protein
VDLLREALATEGRSLEGFELVYQGYLGFGARALPRLPLYGTPEVIAESLRRLSDLGVTMVDLWHDGPADSIVPNLRRFAEEVRPDLDPR